MDVLGYSLRAGAAALIAMLASACANTPASAPVATGLQVPREIREGRSSMVIQSVERDVSRDEIAATISAMIAADLICMRWPSVWLTGNESRTNFTVRFDLMARDWGADFAAQAERRMDEFVEMGFLTKRPLPDGGAEYVLTELGRPLMRGVPYAGERPSFCGPAERQLVDIVSVEWGQFDCGSVNVRFTHTSPTWPSWARMERTQAFLNSFWPAPGSVADGSVSLSRQWSFEQEAGRRALTRPTSRLRSTCYDGERREIYGNGDLNLHLTPPVTE